MSAPSLFSSSTDTPAADKPPIEAKADLKPVGPGQVEVWRSAVLVGLTLLVVLSYWYNPPMNVQPQAGVIMKLPIIIGDYFGKEGEITAIEHRLLPEDTEFARRIYDDTQGHEVNCSIVLSGAEQRSIHRPEACLVGQGWTIIGQDTIPIPLASGHDLLVRKLTLERKALGADNQPVAVRAFYEYWFVGQNVTTPSHFTRILLSNWDRVMYNRAHRWAYVSVFSLVTDNLHANGLDAAQTQKMISDFTRQIVPTFQINEMPKQATN